MGFRKCKHLLRGWLYRILDEGAKALYHNTKLFPKRRQHDSHTNKWHIALNQARLEIVTEFMGEFYD